MLYSNIYKYYIYNQFVCTKYSLYICIDKALENLALTETLKPINKYLFSFFLVNLIF